jgi:acetyl esterase/lipase
MKALAKYMLLVAVLNFSACFTMAAEPPARLDHSRLMEYLASDGAIRPVRSADDWAVRRGQIISGMEEAMGTLPDRANLHAPEMKIISQSDRDGFTRLEITYQAEADDAVPGLLYLPKPRTQGQRYPAALALPPTGWKKNRRVDGKDKTPQNLDYAVELAQRGFVVLVPDYPSLGEYPYDFQKSRFASGTMKGIFNHIRGIDLLIAREDVDPCRIVALGHSLGGHNSMFLGAFDQRVKVVVSCCGWTPAHHYYGGKLDGWAQDRYMPHIRNRFGLDPDRLPFDFYEVAAALAPRAFLSISPLGDDNFDVSGVRKAEPKVREVFALLGASERVEFLYPDCKHDFTPEMREAAYHFIEKNLEPIRK